MDLADLSLLDALTQAATDVLGSIPAQRCIVYIYDKAANLLRSQIVVDCRDKEAPTQPEGKAGSETSEQPRNASKSSAVGFKKEDETTTLLVNFPPVMGMVSSCFLQRRCLRMQDANPHRAFHREYDVPKDMQVDSILCAPVILYHRAAAVIQLLNRLDTTERATTPQDIKDEFSTEVRLQRLKSVNGIVETGFSTKDEQKLMHFTIHIAQTIEINTKKLANVRNHAKIREDKAKQALDLLNALNGTTVAHADNTEVLLATNMDKHTDHSIYMRRATITRLSTQTGVLKDMLAPPGVEFVKHAKRPEVQPDKVNSPRTTSIVSASKVHHGGEKATKPSVRLPAIGSQLEQRKSSLLCCLLPAQRLTGGLAPTSAPPTAQKGRNSVQSEAPASSVGGTAVCR
ncbi:hypothetical protein PI125_g12339 [Phytophthora idaei]|nr:hypothetical protein PI125_g12339 [Phytophthora idaei]